MAEGKKYQFELETLDNALLVTNPREFYTRALLEDSSRMNFRVILNVKEKTKIASLDFEAPIQEYGCDFVATKSTLGAKSMEPCKMSIMTEMCQSEIEESFLAEWMKPGSNLADFAPAQFMAHYFAELARAVSDNLEVITWQGDTEGDVEVIGNLVLCDGIEKKLSEATIPAGQRITGATITSANVIAEMSKVYNNRAKKLRRKKKQTAWYVSSNVADAYALAVAQASAEMYTTKEEDLRFVGIPLIVAEGMSDNTMALSLKDNFVFITDLTSDPDAVETVNMRKTTAEDKLRTRSNFKAGFDILNDSEFTVYGIAAAV